ncbi:HNH endonuclease [Longimicrobium terrae]|uniref:5-methylcytosine-specific restriction endonuclease McrA n=1 Tax=Longimicrobium terrae TaxID=1639882 RepID=A0A841GXL1_9BACT|nr:HNH endonuclease signature motif containing protein [Longimicrobium terrae]MBB4636088.1 5-methylcytosine-specific restriction endonuclease McrA [Longimicrobium terrae]MBB6070483.1 5-methylcytosine-specific restriction endonuclease McrA [Longimicrobium terrae]NNC29474.1 HNH endonuclease [Longimicrobium terrae]
MNDASFPGPGFLNLQMDALSKDSHKDDFLDQRWDGIVVPDQLDEVVVLADGASGPLYPLPEPDSSELALLLPRDDHRAIYTLLHARQDHPPTMAEIRAHAERTLGEAHEQIDRRTRELRTHFLIEVVHRRGSGKRAEATYKLVGRRPAKGGARRQLSAKTEATVFEAYGYRCAMCGRSPKEDRVKLVIDHKIPVDWGGTDDIDNLQALCSEHNHGKQAHFASFDEYGPAIRDAINHGEVHLRIGELLKALQGRDVPVDVVNLVAREENKGDPTRRLRELRSIGWEIKVSKKRVGKRMISYYRLERFAAWPPEGPRAAVSHIETERKKRKRA